MTAEAKPDRFAATAEYFDRRLEMLEARMVALGGVLADLSQSVDDLSAQIEALEERSRPRPRLVPTPRDPGPGAA